ncbi:hypothetical protein QBE53_10905 [Vallitaleaceae bacterium 9-2]
MKKVNVTCEFITKGEVHDGNNNLRITATTIKGAMRFWHTQLFGKEEANELFGSAVANDEQSHKAKVDILMFDEENTSQEKGGKFSLIFRAKNSDAQYLMKYVDALQRASMLGGLGKGKRKLNGVYRIIEVKGEVDKRYAEEVVFLSGDRYKSLLKNILGEEKLTYVFRFKKENDSIYKECEVMNASIFSYEEAKEENIYIGSFRGVKEGYKYKTELFLTISSFIGNNDNAQKLLQKLKKQEEEYEHIIL